MPKLIIIRGPLGVGKTTISKILAQKLGATYLSVDQIIDDNNLVGEGGIPLQSFIKANEIIQGIASKNDNPYIIDGCFYYPEQIADLKKRFNNDIMIITLTADLQTCIERDAGREKVYGEDSAEFVYDITTKVKVGEEIDNTNLSVEEAMDKILAKLFKSN